ncbi:unnamed protein product [Closterium sp. Naga37s-1]|nr:unnamed protein product [Closterium sp. Naga37s-1]
MPATLSHLSTKFLRVCSSSPFPLSPAPLRALKAPRSHLTRVTSLPRAKQPPAHFALSGSHACQVSRLAYSSLPPLIPPFSPPLLAPQFAHAQLPQPPFRAVRGMSSGGGGAGAGVARVGGEGAAAVAAPSAGAAVGAPALVPPALVVLEGVAEREGEIVATVRIDARVTREEEGRRDAEGRGEGGEEGGECAERHEGVQSHVVQVKAGAGVTRKELEYVPLPYPLPPTHATPLLISLSLLSLSLPSLFPLSPLPHPPPLLHHLPFSSSSLTLISAALPYFPLPLHCLLHFLHLCLSTSLHPLHLLPIFPPLPPIRAAVLSPPFVAWLQQMAAGNGLLGAQGGCDGAKCALNGVTVQSVDMFGAGKVGFVKFKADVTDVTTGAKVCNVLLLQLGRRVLQGGCREWTCAKCALNGVTVQSVDMFGAGKVGFVKFKADVTDVATGAKVRAWYGWGGERYSRGAESGRRSFHSPSPAFSPSTASLPGIVFARGPAVGIFMLLRVAEPQPQPQTQGDGPPEPPTDYVVLTEQARVPVGRVLLEMPAGMLDGNHGEYVGTAAKEVKEETGITVRHDHLINLTAFLEPSTGQQMLPSPGGCDEGILLFLYRATVSPARIAKLQGRQTGLRHEGELIKVHVRPLDSIWRHSADCKVLAAVALYQNALREGLLRDEFPAVEETDGGSSDGE